MIILIALEESNVAEDDQYVEKRIKRERLNITIYFLKSEFYNLRKIKKKTKLTKQGARRSSISFTASQ